MHRHLPTGSKQINKSAKRRHDSKRTLKRAAKGRVEAALKGLTSRQLCMSKVQRRNLARQQRTRQRQEEVARRRQLGGREGVPKVVALVALDDGVDLDRLIEWINEQGTGQGTTMFFPQHKQRMTFVASQRDVFTVLDCAKVADIIVFCISSEELDDWARQCLVAVLAQGLPTPLVLLQGSSDVPATHLAAWRRRMTAKLKEHLPELPRVIVVDKEGDEKVLVRALAGVAPADLSWREGRPFMMADSAAFTVDPAESPPSSSTCPVPSPTGTLRLSGYLRGQCMSANDLVCLLGLGVYPLNVIESSPDPCPFGEDKMDEGTANTRLVVLERADLAMRQPPLALHTRDELAGEQTWPTAEELQMAEAEARTAEAEYARLMGGRVRKKKKVPKGTSEYQAAWILNSDEDGEEEDEDESVEEQDKGNGNGESAMIIPEEVEADGDWEPEDGMEDVADDMNDLQKEKDMRRKEEEEQTLFPDEIDTPLDQPARIRLARYRGLKSLRHSQWNPNEILPREYGLVFRFEDFAQTQMHAMEKQRQKPIFPGQYITLHIANVPVDVLSKFGLPADGQVLHQTVMGRPLLVSGLLKHENKLTVLHFSVARSSRFTDPVKSKDPLMLHVGFSTPFQAHPIYSQDVHGAARNTKFERFLTKGRHVASVYAPVVFGAAPVLLFLPRPAQDSAPPTLVASGYLEAVDPDRIVLKKVVLSGYPVKIQKRHAVVRLMFHQPEDVRWFKPVELFTKYGRHGHIREPVGTHGRMKCVFDGQMQAHDTVCMHLFKRQFPKWEGIADLD